jgi:hypothetical protein
MLKRKITINKRAKDWKERYPLVEVKWLDICSDSSWQSLKQLQEAKLPTCVTKGHLLSQAKGITRIFEITRRKKMDLLKKLVILLLFLIPSSLNRPLLQSDYEIWSVCREARVPTHVSSATNLGLLMELLASRISWQQEMGAHARLKPTSRKT